MGKGTETAKLDVIDAFPGLRYDKYFEITSPIDPNYNCIAWAYQIKGRWMWPPKGIPARVLDVALLILRRVTGRLHCILLQVPQSVHMLPDNYLRASGQVNWEKNTIYNTELHNLLKVESMVVFIAI